MSVLAVVGLPAAGLAVALHLAFFLLETVLFDRPAVRRLFGVRAGDDSRALRVFARNQGVYNLGLALVVTVGIAAVVGGDAALGLALVVAGCAVMTLAALALLLTAPRLWPAALAQGVPPLVAIAVIAVIAAS